MSKISDPIGDMLTRIRNAARVNLPDVSMPHSRMKKAIADVLKSEGYIGEIKEVGENKDKELLISLKYVNGESVIDGLKYVSKPSCRIHVGVDNMPKVLNGLGTAVLSTSKGIISNRRAIRENVGGEVLFHVW